MVQLHQWRSKYYYTNTNTKMTDNTKQTTYIIELSEDCEHSVLPWRVCLCYPDGCMAWFGWCGLVLEQSEDNTLGTVLDKHYIKMLQMIYLLKYNCNIPSIGLQLYYYYYTFQTSISIFSPHRPVVGFIREYTPQQQSEGSIGTSCREEAFKNISICF